MPDETIPVAEVYELLDKNWQTIDSPKPRLFDLGRDGRTLRVDFDRIFAPTQGKQDLVIIRPGSATLEEQPIGNWTYGNRIYNIILELYSIESRQRIYNMMAEIRRIMHFKMHHSVGFQRVQFVDFQELYEDNFQFWVGNVSIQLINNAVLLER